MGLFKRFYNQLLGVGSISEKQAKEAPSMEEPELPNYDMKRLIYPDPVLQAEYNEFPTKEKLSVHEHSEKQRKWVEKLTAEEITKKRN